MARPGGVLLPSGVGFPPSLVGLREEGGGAGGRKGGTPPRPVRIGLGGARPHLGRLLLLSTMAH